MTKSTQLKKTWEEMVEILSYKMDSLRCLSCYKYFPYKCEDCSFEEVFDDVVSFLLSAVEEARREERKEMEKEIKLFWAYIDELPNWVDKDKLSKMSPEVAYKAGLNDLGIEVKKEILSHKKETKKI